MANYRSHRPGFLLGWQMNAADMMFRGYTDERMIKELWPNAETPKQMASKRSVLRKLRRDEKFQEYYRSLVSEWSIHHVGRAYAKLAEQIDCDQPWLANKAANDVIQQSKQMLTGMDDGTVVVKIEGMPELGVPEE